MLDRNQYERLLGTMLGPYHLEQLGEWNELGPVFFGRETTSGTTHRIRVLAVSPTFTPEDLAAYPQRFEYQAQHIATLQHPYILPLTHYGTVGGMSYAVSPSLAARSLTVRLRQSGPLDVVTAGRYLDHVAAALEYAHERNTVHRNLTTDAILLQLDGRIVVADFGIRRMIELGERREQRNPLRFVPGGCAPEQLMGGTVDRPADVYALGAVLYQLLTGHPVFMGQTPEEIADQHLRAPVPPLGAWRTGLPGELDALLAKALAKQPQDRFAQPGALANAYAQIVTPNNATRVPFALAPQRPAGQPRVTADVSSAPLARLAESGQVPAAVVLPQASGQASLSRGGRSRARGWRGVGIAAVLVVLVVGGMLGLRAAQNAASGTRVTGQTFFTDGPGGPTGQSDALRIVTRNLAAPPTGTTYYAWLIDPKSERVTALGALHASKDGYTVSYAGTHANLLTLGTTVEVTAERGPVSVPVGQVVLIGSFPPKSFIHIQHVLTSYPTTPNHVGLLVGTFTQDQLLTNHVQTLAHVAASGDPARVQCEAQGIVDILEGTHGAAYQPLSPACAAQDPTPVGDGFGLLGPDDDGTGGGYFSNAAEHASLAATQPDATPNMHTHAAQAEADLNNALRRAVTLHEDALALLKNSSDISKVTEMSTLADEIAHGQGSTGGVLGAYAQAQLMATLTLSPRS